MSGAIIGYFLAVLSMCIYGVYMAPKKLSGLDDSSFTFWMSVGIIVSAVVLYAVVPREGVISLNMIGTAVIAGLVWATGNFAYTLSISHIELTRCTPIKNLSAMFGLLLGMAVLTEGASKSLFKILCIFVSGVLILAGAWLLSRVGAVVKGKRLLSAKDYAVGCLLALWSAIAFSIYTVPMKLCFRAGMTPVDFLFFMSIGIFCGMTLLALWAGWYPEIAVFYEHMVQTCRSKRADAYIKGRLMAMASGVGLTLGQYFANTAVLLAGVAVVWPITKNSVAAVLFSAFVLKDVNWHGSRGFLAWGMVLCLVGIVLMGFGA